jgi:hypothetical protein
MLVSKGDGSFLAGPFDVLCILHNRETGRFHPAFFEDHPFPGPRPERFEDIKVIRLKSRMHHTEGATTLEGALRQLADLTKQISVPVTNIWLKPKAWDGDIGLVWVVDNWLQDPVQAFNDLKEALKNPEALLAELKR